jgi:hypothetical protein
MTVVVRRTTEVVTTKTMTRPRKEDLNGVSHLNAQYGDGQTVEAKAKDGRER